MAFFSDVRLTLAEIPLSEELAHGLAFFDEVVRRCKKDVENLCVLGLLVHGEIGFRP